MTTTELVPNQYWQVQDFFSSNEINDIKNLYRNGNGQFSMVYPNRLLTDYNTTPELQKIVANTAPIIGNIVGVPVDPQVAYISIDLSGSKIMMHRLHPDIIVQAQVVLGGYHDLLGYSVCTDEEINCASTEDYRTTKPVNATNSVTSVYQPGAADIFLNSPRAYVGMLNEVPRNSVREVLVMSYVAKQY